LNHRFDLNFDGAPEFNVAAGVVPFKAGTASGAGSDDAFLRDTFLWQWVRVEQADLAQNMGVDVDGDREEETVSSWEFDKNTNTARVTVLDLQEGDFNLTVGDGAKLYYTEWKAHQIATNPLFVDPGEIRTPGLERDLKMYSYTDGGSGASGDGTYLENREGKLYAANGQFVRNETSQDQLDIVERVLRLNNETGRFCSPNGNGEKGPCGASANCLPTDWSAEEWAKANGLFTMTNPVEACGQCFSSANHKLTCMDISGPTIFVRSRIRDRRRTRWITRTEERD
jgi:hypothetical protein